MRADPGARRRPELVEAVATTRDHLHRVLDRLKLRAAPSAGDLAHLADVHREYAGACAAADVCLPPPVETFLALHSATPKTPGRSAAGNERNTP